MKFQLNKKTVITLSVTIFLILSLVVLYFFHAKIFKIKAIEQSTTRNPHIMDTMAISNRIGENYMGKGFFKISTVEIEKEVLQYSTFIEEVTIEKRFPKTLSISILGREPFLNISNDENFVIVDQEGFVMVVEQRSDKSITPETASVSSEIAKKQFIVTDNSLYADLPLLVAPGVNVEFEVGKKSTFFQIEKISLINRVLTDNGYEIQSIDYLENVFTFNLQGDKRVIFSGDSDMETQLKRFILVAGNIKEEGSEFRQIDLRYERPIVLK